MRTRARARWAGASLCWAKDTAAAAALWASRRRDVPVIRPTAQLAISGRKHGGRQSAAAAACRRATLFGTRLVWEGRVPGAAVRQSTIAANLQTRIRCCYALSVIAIYAAIRQG